MKDEPWNKVVLHSVPIEDFDTPEGMDLVLNEIKTFNKGLNPIGTPYWLTSAEKRQNQTVGSLVVSFAIEQEAIRAIRKRVYIVGISIKVEKHYTIAPSTQCPKYQGFGHLENHYKKPTKYRLYSENHIIAKYTYNVCLVKGTKYIHLAPKYSNYKEAYNTDYKYYETLLIIKAKFKKKINTKATL